jgi:hypothetical protein
MPFIIVSESQGCWLYLAPFFSFCKARSDSLLALKMVMIGLMGIFFIVVTISTGYVMNFFRRMMRNLEDSITSTLTMTL